MTALALAAVMSLATACIPDARLSHVRDRLVAHAMVESGHNPLAIHDNTASKSYLPADMGEARRLLTTLAGHSVDAGIAQVTRANWQWLGLGPENLFDPAANLCGGAVVLIQDYEAACRYNTGKPNCPPGNLYAEAVNQAMERIKRDRVVIPLDQLKEIKRSSPCDAPRYDVWGQLACRNAAAIGPTTETPK